MREPSNSWIRRIWRRTSLVQRLTFVATAPAAIIALLLVTLLTRHQLDSLRDVATGTAQAVATQTAVMAVDPMRNGQRRDLARIAGSVASLPNVVHVQVRAANGEILADVDNGQRQPGALTVTRDILDGNAPPLGSVLVEVSVADALAAQRAALRNALIWLALSLPMAAIIGWQAARWISAPLRRLVNGVQWLAHGNRSVAVNITDDTEIGELQRGFNAAAAAVLDVQRGMERDIERATTELAHKNAALEAASVARARFLAAASHDLRQPLYALTLFSSGLAVDERDPARLDRIAHIQECVEALDNLFSELLDLSRLETGAMTVDLRSFPLDEVFEEVSRNFRMLAEQHGLRLVVRPTAIWVRSDRTMVARMLNNLVSNALRYTMEGGVLVGARLRDGRVRVDVWDTGSGIADEHRERVFEEFYRVDGQPGNERDDGPRRGLGLGLATVRRLAELVGSTMVLKSRPRQGSLFSFELPTTIDPGTPSLAATPRLSRDVAGLRILVIDDEAAILSGIHFLLGSWGCDVNVAEDGDQAMEIAGESPFPPDLVISDLRLGNDENGLDVLARLDRHFGRRTDGPAPFPRLLITGETRSERLREIEMAEIDVLYKPVSPDDLRDAIVALTRRA
jgi:signal transduction histidine kinase/ActR/RegA family two-component response regulator